MSTATLEQEEQAFTTLCDKLIADSPGVSEVENAVIELEVGHKKCLNAARRQFNAEIDKNEAAVKTIREDYEKSREADRKDFQKQLDEVRKDYQDQLEHARQKQNEEVHRIKDTYETIAGERKRSDSLVGRISDDHARELERVNEEWARKMSIKETEIMALKQESEENERIANARLEEEAVRVNAVIADFNALQDKMLELDEQKVNLHEASKTQLDELAAQQERLLKSGQTLLNALQDNASELELSLSRVRVTLLNQDYAAVRDAVRSKESSAQQEEMLKQVDDFQTRKENERRELTELLDRVKAIYAGHKKVIDTFQEQLTEETTKLEAIRKENAEELTRASQARRSRASSISASTPTATSGYPRRGSMRSRRGSTAVGHSYPQGDSPQPRRDSARGSAVSIHEDPTTE